MADANRPVQTQAGFTVLPNYAFTDRPAMNAFLVPGGFGTGQEIHNERLHDYIRWLPERCLLTSVCAGSWVYGAMGLLNGLPATNRKEPDRQESTRVVDAGRIITAGGITSGMEMGFHLLRRAGFADDFVAEVARVIEYTKAYQLYSSDIEIEQKVPATVRS